MRKPIIRRRRSVTVNILALDEALKDGTLSEADRRTAERILPGVCDKIGPRLLELGKTGDVQEAGTMIRDSRKRRGEQLPGITRPGNNRDKQGKH